MASLQIILARPFREEAALTVFPGNDVSAVEARRDFFGPHFTECKYQIKEGVCSVLVEGATYHYPLHTIARLKEFK